MNEGMLLGQEIKTLDIEEKHLKEMFSELELQDGIIREEEHELQKLEKIILRIKKDYQKYQDSFMNVLASRNNAHQLQSLVDRLAEEFVEIFTLLQTFQSMYSKFTRSLSQQEKERRNELHLFTVLSNEDSQLRALHQKITLASIGRDNIHGNITKKEFSQMFREHHKLVYN